MRVRSVAGRPAFFTQRLLPFLAVLALVALCPACSSNRKSVNKVRGLVLVDGKPAAQAQVLLHPAAGSAEELRPSGHTDDQGYFTLSSYVNGDGAPEGDYVVTVTWFRMHQVGGDSVRYNALPKRYADTQTSQLRVTVNKSDNELSPLQLSSQ
jgi:hypothetical protein